jgi:hypothetical protein
MVVDNSQGEDQPLYEMVYVSLAEHAMAEAELRDLLCRAREANERHGITGLLVYHERAFLQLIEGERESVRRLFWAIERDPRHEHVDLIWEGPVRRRSFQHWSMGFVVPDGKDLRGLPGFEPDDAPSLSTVPRGEPGRRVLMTLRDQLLSKSVSQPG